MNKPLADLNSIQRKAVSFGQGPMLVLAGAGSGKTRVLTHRVAYLIEQGIDPPRILAVTFTNKAANEMKERIAALLAQKFKIPNPIPKPQVGTFHATCAKILRKHIHHLGYPNNFLIYDTTDQRALIKQAMNNLDISIQQWNPSAILAAISSAKNELIDHIRYSSYAQGFFQEQAAKIYPEYQRLLQQNEALDFDDLQNLTIRLFEENPRALKYYQNQFEYVLLDEFQDTNQVQYLLTKFLAAPQNNLCVVGDCAQSIYAFRGANLRNVLQFQKDYPKAKTFNLEQNYRSTQNILDAATALIQSNAQAHPVLRLWTKNKKGTPLVIYEAQNEKDEAEYVVEKICKSGGKGQERSCAVLYRTNAQSRALEEAFIRAGLPYQLVGGVRFYERREIKDVLSYLRLIHNANDTVSFKRIVNIPPRGIGPKTLKLEDGSSRRGRGSWKLEKFYEIMEGLRKLSEQLNVLELVDEVLEKVEYKGYLNDGTEEGMARWENVQELRSVATQFVDLSPTESLLAFLESVALLEQTDVANQGEKITMLLPSNPNSNTPITLMTLHSAKGLEFDTVFIVGWEEGLLPHSQALWEQFELEEERRLAYVGITRAKENLYLTYARRRLYFGSLNFNQPSRFLQDIPRDVVKLQKSPNDSFMRYNVGTNL